MEMLEIVKCFKKDERPGNWNGLFKCVENMITYFLASGYFVYAKSTHRYSQDMLNLKGEMDEYKFNFMQTIVISQLDAPKSLGLERHDN